MKRLFATTLTLLVSLSCIGCAPAASLPQQTEPVATTVTEITVPEQVIFPAEITPQVFPELLLLEQAQAADADKDGALSEEEAATVEILNFKKLRSDPEDLEDEPRPVYTEADFSFDLAGIRFFTGLREFSLDLQGGEIFVEGRPEAIPSVVKHFEELYQCTALEKLSLYEMDIASLDLSPFPALTSLGLTGLYRLETVTATGSNLKTLWISDCPMATTLSLEQADGLQQLDIVDLPGLHTIHFPLSGSRLQTLQLNNLPNLRQFDPAPLAELKQLDLFDVAIQSLDVSQNKALAQFCAEGLSLDTLDLRNNPNLEYVINAKDACRALLLADDNRITMIRWTDSQVTEFPLSNLNPDTLEGIDIQGTPIKELDVSPYPKLEHLYYDQDVTTIIR